MDPMTTAALINTGGSLLGGLFGKDKGPGFMTQLNDQKTAMREMIPLQMELEAQSKDVIAKKYGIHPLVLYGAGTSSGYSPTFQYSSGGGVDFESLGQNIGRVAESAMGATERGMTKAMEALSLERMQLENSLLASQISSVNRSNMPVSDGSDYMVPGQPGSGVRMKNGQILDVNPVHQASPRYSHLYGDDDRTSRIYNPDGGDNEIMMLYDFITATAPDELRNMFGRTMDRLRTVRDRGRNPEGSYRW